MGQAVVDHGQHTRVAQQDLVDAVGGRIALVGGHHVAVQHAPDIRQGRGELPDYLARLLLDLRGSPGVAAGAVEKLQAGLVEQRVQRGVERAGHVEILALVAQVRRAEPHRKQGTLELFDDPPQGVARREFPPRWFT